MRGYIWCIFRVTTTMYVSGLNFSSPSLFGIGRILLYSVLVLGFILVLVRFPLSSW